MSALGSLRRVAILAAGLAMASGFTPTLASQPTMISTAPRPVKAASRRLFAGALPGFSRYGRKGAGISMAQQQRTVRKKRGVARNRVNHR